MSRVLLTGAGGYVGRLAAKRLLRDQAPLVLWLSARGNAEAAERRARTAAAIGIAANDPSVSWAFGDLRDDEPFATVPPDGITHVIHAAAVARFNVEAELAERVNHQGTRKVLAFAATLPRLKRFLQVSTIFASGLARGEIREEPSGGQGIEFANHYEASKHKAEQAVAQSGVPSCILRLATAVADTDGGAPIGQTNAFHNTLKLLRYGLLPLVPGHRTTPLYFISGELAAEALAVSATRQRLPGVIHVAHRRDQSLMLSEVLDLAIATFAEDADYRARRILPPPYADHDSFDLMTSGLDGMASPVVTQSLSSIAPFARQLYIAKDIRNGGLLDLLGRDPAPDPRRMVEGACRELMRTRWGRA